jgi:CheR methyltransferase-like protein
MTPGNANLPIGAAKTANREIGVPGLHHQPIQSAPGSAGLWVFCGLLKYIDFALDRARSGVYAANEVAGISKERLTRFFVHHDGGYQIHKSVREMCVFAKQNVVKDPPFSNLDLISCRNLLIYFGPILQKRAIPRFTMP